METKFTNDKAVAILLADIKMNAGWERELDVTDILEDIASAVEDDAQRMAPVDTGALRNSIRHEVDGKGENAEARVGSDLEYSTYQEMGTSRLPANPYLRPALNKKR